MKKQLQESFSKISEIEEINLIYYNDNSENKNQAKFTIVSSELDILKINYKQLFEELENIKSILKNKNIECGFTIINEKELMNQEKTLEERTDFYKELANCTIVYSDNKKLQNLIYARQAIKKHR